MKRRHSERHPYSTIEYDQASLDAAKPNKRNSGYNTQNKQTPILLPNPPNNPQPKPVPDMPGSPPNLPEQPKKPDIPIDPKMEPSELKPRTLEFERCSHVTPSNPIYGKPGYITWKDYGIVQHYLPINCSMHPNVKKWEYLGRFEPNGNKTPNGDINYPGYFKYKVWVNQWINTALWPTEIWKADVYILDEIPMGPIWVNTVGITGKDNAYAEGFDWASVELLKLLKTESHPPKMTFPIFKNIWIYESPWNIRRDYKKCSTLMAQHGKLIQNNKVLFDIINSMKAMMLNLLAAALPGFLHILTDLTDIFFSVLLTHQNQLDIEAYVTKPLWLLERGPQMLSSNVENAKVFREFISRGSVYIVAQAAKVVGKSKTFEKATANVSNWVEKNKWCKRIKDQFDHLDDKTGLAEFDAWKKEAKKIVSANLKTASDNVIKGTVGEISKVFK